jgi:hypothetical protein
METILTITISFFLALIITLKFENKIKSILDTKEKGMAFSLTGMAFVVNWLLINIMYVEDYALIIGLVNHYNLSLNFGSFIVFDLIFIATIINLFAYKSLKILFKNRQRTAETV